MTNLDLSQAIESAAKAVWDHYWVDEQGAPADDFSNPVIGNREIFLDDATRALAAALPHILEALATEAQAETFDDAVWCRCVSETDPADCSECTPRLSSNWIRAKAEEARA